LNETGPDRSGSVDLPSHRREALHPIWVGSAGTVSGRGLLASQVVGDLSIGLKPYMIDFDGEFFRNEPPTEDAAGTALGWVRVYGPSQRRHLA